MSPVTFLHVWAELEYTLMYAGMSVVLIPLYQIKVGDIYCCCIVKKMFYASGVHKYP
jgi:hypothetical protein